VSIRVHSVVSHSPNWKSTRTGNQPTKADNRPITNRYKYRLLPPITGYYRLPAKILQNLDSPVPRFTGSTPLLFLCYLALFCALWPYLVIKYIFPEAIRTVPNQSEPNRTDPKQKNFGTPSALAPFCAFLRLFAATSNTAITAFGKKFSTAAPSRDIPFQ
jgi:hypothetical protein